MNNLLSIKALAGLLLGASILTSCEPESAMIQQESPEVGNFTASIDRNSLVGEWKVSTMEADTLVDLNGDGTGNYNLLLETACFDNMGVVFNDDGTLSTTNSKLDFRAGPNGDEFACTADRTDTGIWRVEGDELVMDLNIDGNIYTNRKQITQTETTFGFEVTKFESQQYVDDPGDTHASHIRILALEYTKVN
ncbi:DUF5004 domain-containing protein [Salegentibacter chungangensis]|uniref:DUF5004 domain-containing protein n=1 Tax=Salegentibacter chungangensis TaxID=1335724 RepID=A0ABW3NKZ4_9FLAO